LKFDKKTDILTAYNVMRYPGSIEYHIADT